MKKLKVKGIGENMRNIGLRCGMNRTHGRKNPTMYNLRRAGIWYNERDLTIMLMILGNRHLAPLAHVHFPHSQKFLRWRKAQFDKK